MQTKVFCKRLKTASVVFELRTENGRLFQADWPAIEKAWRPYTSAAVSSAALLVIGSRFWLWLTEIFLEKAWSSEIA